jgi:hypothetical protein
MPYKDKSSANAYWKKRIADENLDRELNPEFYMHTFKVCTTCNAEKCLMDFSPAKAICKVCNGVKSASNRRRSPELSLWRNARKRARDLGREFTITPEDCKIPELCPVLGIPMSVADYKPGTIGANPNSPSLDRIDSTKGYTPENTRVISYRANALKSDATPDELRRILAYVEGRLLF